MERELRQHTDEELRARFEALDLDGNGFIDADEFIKFSLREALQRSSVRVFDLFQKWDTDKSGQLDRTEFRQAMKSLELDFIATDAEIDSLFLDFDYDGSGKLSYKVRGHSSRA